jgi:hypothetical protein
MQKLMSTKILSRKELQLIKGAGEPGGNNNPPKGANKLCGPEPIKCKDPLWLEWAYCVGKEFALNNTFCIP